MKGCIWNVSVEDRLCRYCKMAQCESRNRKGVRKLGRVTPTMRGMAVGDTLEMDFVEKNAARTCAWRLKRESGARFMIYARGSRIFIERIG